MENQGEILDDHDDQDRSLLLTVKQAAAEISCSEAHVRRLIASGDLPAIRLGEGPRSPYRVPWKVLEGYVYRRLEEGPIGGSQRPELKTRRASGSSASWAFTFAAISPIGGFHA